MFHFVVVTMKNFVTMEQNVCQVCGKTHDTGNLLLDLRLRPLFEMNTVTGFGMCKECNKLHDDDYIALVGIDETKSTVTGNIVKPEDAYRTGSVLHMARKAAKSVFNVPEASILLPMWFVQESVIEAIKAKVNL